MTPADLKAEGQSRSLFAVSDTTRQDFERILTLAPIEFSSNDIREYMEWAQIPESTRGGLFSAAIKAGLIVRKMTADGPPWRIPSTDPKTHGAYVQVYRRAA